MRPDPIGSSEPRFPVDSRESASFRDTRSQPAAGLNPPRSRRFKPVSSTSEAPVDHEIRRGIFRSGAPTRPKRLRRVALPLEFRRRAATSSPTIRSSATTREPPSPVDGDAAFRVRVPSTNAQARRTAHGVSGSPCSAGGRRRRRTLILALGRGDVRAPTSGGLLCVALALDRRNLELERDLLRDEPPA